MGKALGRMFRIESSFNTPRQTRYEKLKSMKMRIWVKFSTAIIPRKLFSLGLNRRGGGEIYIQFPVFAFFYDFFLISSNSHLDELNVRTIYKP